MIRRRETLEDLLGNIEILYEEGKVELAAREIERGRDRFHAVPALLEWEAVLAADAGRLKEALSALHRALGEEPGRRSALREKASILQGLGRFEDSLEVLLDLGPEGDSDASFHHLLAQCQDRLGRTPEARRNFLLAHHLSPEGFPAPIQLSRQEFETLVLKVIVDLPGNLRRHLEKTRIQVSDYPTHRDQDPYLLALLVYPPPLRDTSPRETPEKKLELFQRNFEVEFPDREWIEKELRRSLENEIYECFGEAPPEE